MPKPIAFMFERIRLPEHPCPNQNSVHMHLCSRSYDYQSIHVITFMFESIRLPEQPCPSRSYVPVRAHTVNQSIHGQTTITFMVESIQLPKHPCPNHNNIHVRQHTVTRASMHKPKSRSCSRAYGDQRIHAPTIIASMFQSIRT